MNKLMSVIAVSCLSVSIIGCQNMTKQDVGTVAGGVAGGLLGSQFGPGSGKNVAIAAGTLAGAYLGGAVGKSMDDVDRMKMNQALENNKVGQPAYWTNQKSDTRYKVLPTKNVTVQGNRYCREYTTTATVAGKQQQVYGTACRQPDGTWKMVS